jgi:cobalt/nickel transport system permease protein
MHMADALISPAVGGIMWAGAAGAVAYSSAQLRRGYDERRVPLMGVLGAFVFAAQMINVAIPGTGSSGHLGGGLLLAVLLGPHAALLAISSVLMVQSLLFADGGLLALGCNIVNMGIIPAYLIYPLCFRPLAGPSPTRSRRSAAIMIAAVLALQSGALAVVLQTTLSGIAALPFTSFVLLMQPVHLVIGLLEGAVTAAVVSLISTARPELVVSQLPAPPAGLPLRRLLTLIGVAALLTGGLGSLVASNKPDGLEWAIRQVAGSAELANPQSSPHRLLATVQERLALLPDYGFRPTAAPLPAAGPSADRWETSLAGLVGGGITVLFLSLGGLLLRMRRGSP